eukprot:1104989-Lingulodinium_polyedra.AAC.1
MMSSAPCGTSPRGSRRIRAPLRSNSHTLYPNRRCGSVSASLALLPQWVCTACAKGGPSSAKPLATNAPVALTHR